MFEDCAVSSLVERCSSSGDAGEEGARMETVMWVQVLGLSTVPLECNVTVRDGLLAVIGASRTCTLPSSCGHVSIESTSACDACDSRESLAYNVTMGVGEGLRSVVYERFTHKPTLKMKPPLSSLSASRTE